MQPVDIQALVRFGKLGVGLLRQRVLTLVGMALCSGSFGYALFRADWIVSATACAFAVLVYWPALKLDREAAPQQGDSNG